MANNNNIYYNAAYCGVLAGCFAGRTPTDAVQADYLSVTQTAQAIAQEIDSLIPFDALVTTNAAVTQLAITTNTIAANEMFRVNLLWSIVFGTFTGRYPTDNTKADYAALAAAIVAAWNEALLLLVTP